MKWDTGTGPDEEASEVLCQLSRACWERIGKEAGALCDDEDTVSRIVISALTLAVANEAASLAASRSHLASVLHWISATCAEAAINAYVLNREGDGEVLH